MKKIFLLLFFFTFITALHAKTLKEVKKQLPQMHHLLQQEIRTISGLPEHFSTIAALQPVFFSSQNTGAVAEYKAQENKIYLFKNLLQQWLQSQNNYQPQLLARCLAPVYIHEISHARENLFARQEGFVWPVTAEDEYIAVFWQIYFIQQKLKTDPQYYQKCAAFMPLQSFLASDSLPILRKRVFDLYFSVPTALLPPPLESDNIDQLLQNKKIYWQQKIFSPKRRFLSLQRFFKKGGSWLEIKPKELQKIQTHPYFLIYQHQKSIFHNEITDASLP